MPHKCDFYSAKLYLWKLIIIFNKITMRLIRRGYMRYCLLAVFLSLLYILLRKCQELFPQETDTISSNKYMYFPETGATMGPSKIFWEGKVSQKEEEAKVGLGEQGQAAYLSNQDSLVKQDLWDTNGYNALLSDSISLNRSLKDVRNPKCKEIRYNVVLPTVSVVIPFFEEHLTTLLRTVVSVVNRSPPALLKEVILVDDGSTMKDFLRDSLELWLVENQPIAKVIRLPQRVGLILARQAGIKVATGDVIVVLDSHCEVMTDWLPPLLEPIVENPRTAVCPYIDVIDSENMAYYPQDEGARGAFDWRLYYKRLPLRDADVHNLPNPFENPVMNGGLFAISRKFFWELGGYDPGLKIWGGEQYDLSFKIWQCGGRLLDAPCSRVGHIFRKGGKKRPAAKNAGDFLSKNYKRVAIVWMDEYIEALYKRNPRLRDVDPGNVSSEIEIRTRLQCKPFKWFLETVAPDLLKQYPPIEPPDFANGTIKSVALPSYCMDTGSRENGDLILYSCHGLGPQYFSLGWKKTLKVENEQFCWAAAASEGKAPHIQHCQKNPSVHQIWRYDPVSQQLQEKAFLRCLQINLHKQNVFMAHCDISFQTQKWIFQNVNSKLIFEKYPVI